MLTYNFGSTLSTQRKQQALTSKNLAELSSLAKSFIDYLEHGKRSPSAETIKALALALNIDYMILLNALMLDYKTAIEKPSE